MRRRRACILRYKYYIDILCKITSIFRRDRTCPARNLINLDYRRSVLVGTAVQCFHNFFVETYKYCGQFFDGIGRCKDSSSTPRLYFGTYYTYAVTTEGRKCNFFKNPSTRPRPCLLHWLHRMYIYIVWRITYKIYHNLTCVLLCILVCIHCSARVTFML